MLEVIVDIKKDSVTYGKDFSIELSNSNNLQPFIFRGFLDSLTVLKEKTYIYYKCDNYYNNEAKVGVIYNDQNLNIDWRLNKEDAFLSEKDEK